MPWELCCWSSRSCLTLCAQGGHSYPDSVIHRKYVGYVVWPIICIPQYFAFIEPSLYPTVYVWAVVWETYLNRHHWFQHSLQIILFVKEKCITVSILTSVRIIVFLTETHEISYGHIIPSEYILEIPFQGLEHSAGKGTCCFWKRSRFSSQHLSGGLKLSVTPVPGDLVLFSCLHGHQAYVWCTYIHADKTPIHMK